MGCISSTNVKNPKKNNENKENNKHIEPALYKSKLDKSTVSRVFTPRGQELPSVEKFDYPVPLAKIVKISSVELLSQYEISETLEESTRLEGPKLLINKIHGGTNVLRVYQCDRIDEERLKKYHEILKFELYTDEEENYLVINQYCSGKCISNLFEEENKHEEQKLEEERSSDELNQQKQLIHSVLLQVHDIITKFHSNKTYLGNLNLFSFKKVSDYNNEIRLVKFNVENLEENDRNYEMGHAHKNSFQADWEFFGYLVQFYYSEQSPIFISHKMQYVESKKEKGEEFQIIESLLKGREVHKKQVEELCFERIKLDNRSVLNGYRFCRDVIRLIKCRRRRMKHKACYYSEEIREYYKKMNTKESDYRTEEEESLWRMENGYLSSEMEYALSEDNLHKLEMERIFREVEKYIEEINSKCEEHFINYSSVGENFRKLKEVFLIIDKRKKLEELKELISQIK